jgi:membrane protein
LFAAIYKVLPDVQIAWRDVWMGAVVTAALFTVGKWALGLYLGSSTIGSGYGAAGSFVVLLLWIFYSAQILLFGAEFTQVYARTYGTRIAPSKNAVMLTELDRAHQGIPHATTVQALAAADKPSQAKKKSRVEIEEERRLEAEQERLAAAVATTSVQPAPEPTHLGALVLGICVALATFVVGMLIGTDQKTAK